MNTVSDINKRLSNRLAEAQELLIEILETFDYLLETCLPEGNHVSRIEIDGLSEKVKEYLNGKEEDGYSEDREGHSSNGYKEPGTLGDSLQARGKEGLNTGGCEDIGRGIRILYEGQEYKFSFDKLGGNLHLEKVDKPETPRTVQDLFPNTRHCVSCCEPGKPLARNQQPEATCGWDAPCLCTRCGIVFGKRSVEIARRVSELPDSWKLNGLYT